MTDQKFLDYLRKKLATRTSYDYPKPKGSIMNFEGICDHDEAFFCEHRLEWLLNEVKNHLQTK